MGKLSAFAFVCLLVACGDDVPADEYYVGGQCVDDDDCLQDDEIVQTCLTQFAGGYCGLEGCTEDEDCPGGSACVTHDDGVNYCFRICVDKPDCNRNRDVENEANCSSSVDFVEPNDGLKACVPPSSGV